MTSPQMHLWPEAPTLDREDVLINVAIELATGERARLWYRLPAIYQAHLAPNCDPFVRGVLFIAMHHASDLVVHGTVSPSLLQNLEEFQSSWNKWMPEKYTQVQILPDQVSEPSNAGTNACLVAFSGGLDSSFTVLRHHTGSCGVQRRDIQAGVFLHGFDIPLRLQDEYQRALVKARASLASLGLQTIPLSTNLKKLHPDWNDAHGAILASCLSLLSGSYTAGLIASSLSYKNIQIPWGSNPLTDPMLSSRTFAIIHDGAEYIRCDKVLAVAAWPEALENLRVCLVGASKDRNCCQCEKCIRTILAFRAWGLDRPACFERDVSVYQIIRLKLPLPFLISHYQRIVSIAQLNTQPGAWVHALKISIFINRILLFLRRIKLASKFIGRIKGG